MLIDKPSNTLWHPAAKHWVNSKNLLKLSRHVQEQDKSSDIEQQPWPQIEQYNLKR